jgi:hypothetical protein
MYWAPKWLKIFFRQNRFGSSQKLSMIDEQSISVLLYFHPMAGLKKKLSYIFQHVNGTIFIENIFMVVFQTDPRRR